MLTVFGSPQPLHSLLPPAHLGLLKLSGRSEPAGTGAWFLVFLPHDVSNQACAFCPLCCTAGFFFDLAFAPVSVLCFSFQGSFLAYPFFPTVISVYQAFVWWTTPSSSSFKKKSRKGMYSTYIHIQITQMENVVNLSEVKQTCISFL